MKKSSNLNNSTKPKYVSSKRSNVKRRLIKLDPPPFFEVFPPIARLRVVINPIVSHCSRCGYDTSSETLHYEPKRGFFAVLTCRNCGKIHFLQKRFSQLLKFVENDVFQREEAKERWDELISFSGEGGDSDA